MATDGGGGMPTGVSFPLKVHTEEEDFVIEMDENSINSPPDGFDLGGDRVRCKRRKRCGQCGPCQVKENCMKCHFCIRKDVLKQTCIYRKCVYLRSKPKPYSRPRPSPQPIGSVSMTSPKRSSSSSSSSAVSAASVIKSPIGPGSIPMPFQDHLMSRVPQVPPEALQQNNPFFPPQLPQQQHMTMTSTFPPGVDTVTPKPSFQSPQNTVNMNMHMNMSQQYAAVATSPPQKVPEQSPPPVPPIPNIPPVVNSPPTAGNNSVMQGGMHERTFGDIRPSEQLFPTPQFPPPHMPHPNSSYPHRGAQFLSDQRVPRMNFPNPMENHRPSLSNDSSCMYHPSLPPYSVPGHFHQPSVPSPLFSGPSPDMFRSPFLPSFPPGYTYPPNRLREGFSGMSFPSIGMPNSTPFSPYGQGTPQPFPSQQYTPYNQQNGCPKNGCGPPASPSITMETDAKVMQEGYGKSADKSDKHAFRHDRDVTRRSPFFPPIPFWEPWRSPWRSSPWRMPWMSPTVNSVDDDSRSRLSTVSSDFECDVISIDDLQMNAYIRSDGCNSLEIEFDDRSVADDFQSPVKGRRSSLFSPLMKDKDFNDSDDGRLSDSADISPEKSQIPGKKVKKGVEKPKLKKPEKHTFKGIVCLKQDLGDEGIIQLELPGHRVTIEDTVLNDEMTKDSCNVEELMEFIKQKPDLQFTDENTAEKVLEEELEQKIIPEVC